MTRRLTLVRHHTWDAALVPRRPDQTQAPWEYAAPDGTWPHGPWQVGTPVTVRYAAVIAERLEQAIWDSGLNVAELARQMGVSRRTLHAVLSGHVLPDMRTIALAEQTLGVRLWPEAAELF